MLPILLTISFILFAILAWRNLKMALILLSGLLPIYLLRLEIGPIPSTALEILVLICVVVWIIKLIRPDAHTSPSRRLGEIFSSKNTSHAYRQADHFVRSGNKWIQPTILLIAAACFGAVVAPDLFSALGIWKAYFIEPILVAIMMITTFNRKDWIRCLQALSISAIVISIFAIFQYLTGTGIPTPWDIELRVTSFFDYPNALGLFLAPIVAFNAIKMITGNHPYPLLRPIRQAQGRPEVFEGRKEGNLEPNLSPFRRGSWRGLPWISILTIILSLIAITLSQTEAALVAMPTAVIITLLISGISKKSKLILIALSVLLVLFSLLIPTSREKLLLQDYSGQVRISQWTETIELIKEKPFFGAGLNGYPTALEPHHDSTLYEIFQYPHNIFLNTWTELGLIGLITLFWFGYLIVRKLVSPPSQGGAGGGCRDPIQLALFAALLTIAIHGLVDVPYFKNDLSILTWILLAGFMVVSNKQNNKI